LFELSKIYKLFFKTFFIFIILNLILLDWKKNSYYRNINKNKQYYFNQEYTNRTILFQKINEYINLCRNGTLINDVDYDFYFKPKITVIIPVYNASKTIKSSIRSIQNQNMIEIEIILVDDASKDNSTDIIRELMLEDKRIKLIKNNENKGILYSRSIGALKAKGKYIMALDNDDFFIFGIFNKCYEEAEKNNLDIIEFSGLQICINCSVDMNNFYIPYYLRFKEDGLIIKQPELSNFIYIKKNNSYSYDFNDVFVWGKLIKTLIYQKAIKLLGHEIFKHKIFLTEDKIFTFSLFKVANSFKFIDTYGIIYVENPISICHSWIKSKKQRILKDFLLFCIIFYNLNKDNEKIQIVVEDLKIRFFEYDKYLEGEYKKLFIGLYTNLLKNENIIDSEKEILKNLIKKTKQYKNTF